MKRLILGVLLASPLLAQTNISGTGKITGKATAGTYLANPVPQMGWSSWPGLSCPSCYVGGFHLPITAPTATAVQAEADNLANPTLAGLCAVEYAPGGGPCVSLTALGYTYVAIDVGWDECTTGSPPCTFQPIASQFPSGISGIATYVHGKSQLLSLYGSPANTDCANYPGQYQHETADAALLASWAVDEFRFDWCSNSLTLYGPAEASAQAAFQAMGNALRATGRPFAYDINFYNIGTGQSNLTGPAWFQGAGGSRIRIGVDNPQGLWYQKFTGDLSFATPYQSKGHWLDFDVLMGGLSESNQSVSVGDTEARAQFNMHAITASANLIGNLIENLDATNLQTYANSEVIAVNQDSLGKMGTLRDTTTCGATVCQVWTRLLANGDYAIALINYDPSNAHTVSVLWSDFGQSGTFNIRDLWTHSSAGSSSTGYSVSLPAWGSAMVRISR